MSPVSSWADTRSCKGVLETLYDALHLELRVARGSHTLLHPGKAAETEAGWLGELHPTLLDGTWGAFELDLETLFAGVPERDRLRGRHHVSRQCFRTSRWPSTRTSRSERSSTAARETAGALLREARVFDVYRGDQVGAGRKSVAIHLAFQSPERTLTEEEATKARARVIAALAEQFGAELRA